MSWMNQLYQTYENNIERQNVEWDDEIVLTPIAHIYQKAQIEVTINQKDEFVSANVVDKEQCNTLIPVTEASAGRSSGVAPHALSDTLSYIAGDFSKHCCSEKEKKTAEDKFAAYMDQLGQWCLSDYSNDTVKSIYHYLKKEMLIEDLILVGIVEVDDKNNFSSSKINGVGYEKCIVRFRVNGFDDQEPRTWKNQKLINDYKEYYLSRQGGEKEICFLSGEMETVTENHPKGIVAASYGAKLVSCNDNQGFTYRGRFQSGQQAYSLSYESSQKIHSALTWLGKKQGVYVGTKEKSMFICWNQKDKKVPSPFDALGLEEMEPVDNSAEYKKMMKKFLKGYADEFDDTDEVTIIGLDAATTGRLSIIYYNELSAKTYFERMEDWRETCNWMFPVYENDKVSYCVQTPTFYQIVQRAFGTENTKANDKIVKEQTKRLLKCMMDKQTMPWDMVQTLVRKASNPLSYSSWLVREKVLSTACAMITKYYYDKNIYKEGEKDYMKLDHENRDRSYLFGRLLAVYERVERSTYERGEKREPNAIRLQSAYVNHPMQTWKILEGVTVPYFEKITPGSREYYKAIISEITALFQEDDCDKLNRALKESYLLGYYLQRAEFYKKKEKEEEEKKDEYINE